MKARFKYSLFVLLIIAVFPLLSFGDTFQLTASGGGVNLSAVLTANPTGTPGQFLITGISGTYNGSAIAGLLPGGPAPTISPSGAWQYDNVLYMDGNPFFDYWGLGFSLPGNEDANLFYNPPFEFGFGNSTSTILYPESVSVSAVPEPASIMLLGTGLLAAVGKIRRRFC